MTSVVGHRGWPSRFPDNTLAGFLAAASVTDSVELDVRRSGDGKLVLSHDPTLGGLDVSVESWATLGEVDLGDGHKPALLDEVVAALPSTSIEFEIKNLPHQPGFEPDHRIGLEAAARARPGDIVTSFYWPTLAAVKATFPEVATGALLEGDGDMEKAIQQCLDVGHRAIVPHETSLDHTSMAAIAAAGLECFTWTVNDPARALELAGMGVDGIITDDPGLMIETLGGMS